jgi:hypothetical protein
MALSTLTTILMFSHKMIKVLNGQSLSFSRGYIQDHLHRINMYRDSLTWLSRDVFDELMSKFDHILYIKITLLNSI